MEKETKKNLSQIQPRSFLETHIFGCCIILTEYGAHLESKIFERLTWGRGVPIVDYVHEIGFCQGNVFHELLSGNKYQDCACFCGFFLEEKNHGQTCEIDKVENHLQKE